MRHPTTRVSSCATSAGLRYFTADALDDEQLAVSTMYESEAECDEAQALAEACSGSDRASH